ncbi:unnamed protein product [Oppiella nova]|uniref:Groucho/TLE N-terminal Q-rich domain-containing protein n=1 Tax=Oppiella nova TaxID=334625 RepID=A0A7R9QD62_9ACAR|nr:unnamed protein product [Oppiella nova]CAG2162938.1 unnamed protein product [Oppiella nova]
MYNSRHPGPPQAGQPFKFTVTETCERIKEEFNFLQAQYHSLKLELEKLATEKTEMQRHYVMYYEMSYGLNVEMHKQYYEMSYGLNVEMHKQPFVSIADICRDSRLWRHRSLIPMNTHKSGSDANKKPILFVQNLYYRLLFRAELLVEAMVEVLTKKPYTECEINVLCHRHRHQRDSICHTLSISVLACDVSAHNTLNTLAIISTTQFVQGGGPGVGQAITLSLIFNSTHISIILRCHLTGAGMRASDSVSVQYVENRHDERETGGKRERSRDDRD